MKHLISGHTSWRSKYKNLYFTFIFIIVHFYCILLKYWLVIRWKNKTNCSLMADDLRSSGWGSVFFEVKWVSRFSHVRLFATPWTVSTPGSSVLGIIQARMLEWVAIHFQEFPDPGNKPASPALHAGSLWFEPAEDFTPILFILCPLRISVLRMMVRHSSVLWIGCF